MKKVFVIAMLLPLMAVISCSRQETMAEMTDRVFEVARQQCVRMAASLDGNTMPRTFEGDSLVLSPVRWWCSGFFPGTLWYVYEYTGSEEIRELAEQQTMKVEPIKDVKHDHDVGFQINCSFGNGYRLTGNEHYRDVMHTAAHSLATRFNPNVGCTRSWDWVKKGRDWKFPVIIDNMMNMELLLSVAAMYGEQELSDIAVSHAATTMKNHFREDFSCFHLVDYDPETGAVRSRETVQGYADSSSWARGQAWALYGYSMVYGFTGKAEFLAHAENIADMLLSELPEDGIPYWDFDAPDIPDALRDASAGAIMASAFITLSTQTSDRAKADSYLAMAERQLRTLASDEYLAGPGENGGFILRHSVGNLPGDSEVDVPLTYADYYFLEALVKYAGHNNL